MNKLSLVFMGTPEFSVSTLESLSKHAQVDLRLVISMPDRPSGRGHELKSPEVITFAREHSINYFQTENINKEESLLQKLEEEKIDIIIVLAFAQFLGERVLHLPRLGCFNIHTSLLPKFRGAAPIQYSILAGEEITGVTIQRMVKKMDAGDIAFQKLIPIEAEETSSTLFKKLQFAAGDSINEFISLLIENKVKYQPQDETKVSFAPTINKDDGFLDFALLTKKEIDRKIRAYDPWPGTYCFLNNKRLKIFKASNSTFQVQAGKLILHLGQILVGCLDGTLRLEEIQLEGKKRCRDTDLGHGFRESPILTKPLKESI